MSMITMNNHSAVRGFTMIELLVAVFVLAVGLLGLAALQTRGLQYNFSAYQRSQATFLAYDMIDRMRANGPEVMIGSYNFALGAGPVSATDCQSAGANCTANQIAQFDLTQWVCALGRWNQDPTCQGMNIEGPLADGDGSVQVNIPVGGRPNVTVTITWTDDRTLDAADPNRTETFTVSTVL